MIDDNDVTSTDTGTGNGSLLGQALASPDAQAQAALAQVQGQAPAQADVPAQSDAPAQAAAPAPAQTVQPAASPAPATTQAPAQPQAPDDLPRFHRTVGNTFRGMLMGLVQGGIPGAVEGAVSPQWAQRNANQAEQAKETALKTQHAQFQFQTAQAAAMAADATMKAKQVASYDETHQQSVYKANEEMASWFMEHGYNPTTVTANDGQSEMAAAKGMGTVPPIASLQVAPGQIMHFDLSQMPQQVGLDAVNQLNTQIGKPQISSSVWGQTPQNVRLQQVYNASQYWTPSASPDALLQYKNDRARVAAIPDQQFPDKAETLQKYDSLIKNMQGTLDSAHSKDEAQKIADYKAETPSIVSRAGAVASADAAARAQYDNKPVYALNANGDTVITTSASARQQGMTAIRPVKEADITKDQHDIKVLSDIQVKANNLEQTAGAMDNKSWSQAAYAAKYLADNPNTTLNTLFKSTALKNATPQTQAYITAVNSLRESSMGLQKVLTGTARTNETQLAALLNTLPGIEPSSGMVKQKLGAFTQNLSLLSRGLPKGTGVELQGFNGQQQPQSNAQFQKYSSDGKWGWNGSQWMATGK